ncbi:phosphohistidine phosphatase SixA [Petrachloros mirabilis]
MDCVLIRHGVAVERDEWEGDDADRPLTDDGVKRVRQVAAGLKRLDLCPTHVFSSPLVRAVETAGILCAVLELPEAVTQVPDLSPDADLEGALTTLRRLPPDSCVFCVGHEPHLGLLAGLLLTGKPSQAFHFKKAGACLIELPRSVKPCQGLLRWWMEPGQLRALGKKKAKARIKVES